jgi:hypothetical protein
MTTQATGEPLDRLNYYNGQRLEAEDLRTEQDYHIRVRRLLHQALYTPGIASGLEVSPGPNPHTLTLSPGVALDALGREVILIEATDVQVRGLPRTDPAWVYSNFLFIQYAEEQTGVTSGGCRLAAGGSDLAWAGPTRIRALPLVGFADTWPNEGAGQILLAQVELDAGCAVAQIHNQARKYVDAVKAGTRSLSFEGDKDLDRDNGKKLSFHVAGGSASAVTLYLWADAFPSLYYTQLGAHEHQIPAIETTSQDGLDLAHSHEVDLSQVTVGDAGSAHGSDHDIKFPANKQSGNLANKIAIDVDDNVDGTKLLSQLGNDDYQPAITGGLHTHDALVLPAGGVWTLEPDGGLALADHHHTTLESTTGATGQGGASDVIPAGRTKRLTHLDALRVYLDAQEITDAILAQLGGPTQGWDRLGDGTSGHALVASGTGAIALERIATIGQGEHTLEFKVDNDSGGNIRYNLYVE